MYVYIRRPKSGVWYCLQHSILPLPIYQYTKLPNCQIVKLPNCKIVKLYVTREAPKGIWSLNLP